MAKAGTVEIEFAAQTARFVSELKKVQTSMKRIEGDFKSLDRVAGVAMRVFSGVALANFARQAFEAADATATAAERAGIAVETFSRLQYAAGQTDIEISALTSGVQRFQIALSKADDESKQAIATLSRFGLQAEQLRSLSIEDQLAAVAEAFKQIADPADRTRLAVELFGKSAGPQLVPLLSQGKAGIQQLTAEADRLGITMSATTAAGIDQADRAIKQLTSTLSAYTSKFLAGLSIAILGPPDEIQKVDLQMRVLQDRIRQITQGVGGGDPATILGRDNPLFKELTALRAEFEILLAQKEALYQSRAQQTKPADKPLPEGIEFDLKAIRSMRIEVDELGVAAAAAYEKLRATVEAAPLTRMAEISAIVGAEYIESQRQVEEQITSDLEFQLQARAALESHYREERYQQDIAYSLARSRLEQTTWNNVLGAMQAFAGQSQKVAIALVGIQKARALAEAFMLGRLSIAQAAASAPPPANFAAIAWATTVAAANVAAIAASGYGQIRAIKAAGGAPIGSPVNPAVVSGSGVGDDVAAGASSVRAVQVIIQGNVIGNQQFIDQMIRSIESEVRDRDVILIRSDSRNAQEIRGDQ